MAFFRKDVYTERDVRRYKAIVKAVMMRAWGRKQGERVKDDYNYVSDESFIQCSETKSRVQLKRNSRV